MPGIYVPAVIPTDSNGNITVPLKGVGEIFGFPFTQGCTELQPAIFQVKKLCFCRCLFIWATTTNVS